MGNCFWCYFRQLFISKILYLFNVSCVDIIIMMIVNKKKLMITRCNHLQFPFLQLFSQGKLAGEKVAKLKAKYTSLHERLKSTREQESSLLHEAKEMHQEVQHQRAELEKGDSFPDGDNTEVNKLRQELLKHHNELAQADERQYQLEFKLEGLQEEKMMLQREYSRMPKPGEIEKTGQRTAEIN